MFIKHDTSQSIMTYQNEIEYKDIVVRLHNRPEMVTVVDRIARTSTGVGDEGRTEDQVIRLLRYMIFNGHLQPFEMINYRFYIECPIDVAIHLLRHRTASFNMQSRRYVDSMPEFHRVEQRGRKKGVKQGGGEVINIEELDEAVDEHHIVSYDIYGIAIEEGISPETARRHLPMSTMTKMYMSIDLRNLFHFLNLRTSEDAYKETREVASAMEIELYKYDFLAWTLFKSMNMVLNFMQSDFMYTDFKLYSDIMFNDQPNVNIHLGMPIMSRYAEQFGISNETFWAVLNKLWLIAYEEGEEYHFDLSHENEELVLIMYVNNINPFVKEVKNTIVKRFEGFLNSFTALRNVSIKVNISVIDHDL